jgi:hypothetical protein
MLADCLASQELGGYKSALLPGREDAHLQTVLPQTNNSEDQGVTLSGRERT